jgi:hypothetical protein
VRESRSACLIVAWNQGADRHENNSEVPPADTDAISYDYNLNTFKTIFVFFNTTFALPSDPPLGGRRSEETPHQPREI